MEIGPKVCFKLKHSPRATSHAWMRLYEQRTREIIRRFICGELTFPACIAALDANLARVNFELEQRGPPIRKGRSPTKRFPNAT
jgi:hypothetical protein